MREEQSGTSCVPPVMVPRINGSPEPIPESIGRRAERIPNKTREIALLSKVAKGVLRHQTRLKGTSDARHNLSGERRATALNRVEGQSGREGVQFPGRYHERGVVCSRRHLSPTVAVRHNLEVKK